MAQRFGKETGIATRKWDVSNYDACASHLEAIAKEDGPVEILVNNAGITRDAMFHKMTPQQWNEVVNTNLNALFNMTRPVWEGSVNARLRPGDLHLSINGQKGQMGQVNYLGRQGRRHGIRQGTGAGGRRQGHQSMPSRQAISAPRWCGRSPPMCWRSGSCR